MLAARLDSPEVVQFLIDNGADVKSVDNRGRGPRQYAILSEKPEAARIIEQAGG
jgi:hypothetical protein